MNRIFVSVVGIALALTFAPKAGADPTLGHVTFVKTEAPAMLCQIGSDDADPGFGPNVVCQSDPFPRSAQRDQAYVTAEGNSGYRNANIGTGGDDFHPQTLTAGRTYRLQGWTVTPTSTGITFTNDATGHGMAIDGDRNVTAF